MKGAARWILRRWLGDVRPIVVGGTGGSGTRVVRAVLARAGAFMGVRLNGAGDAMDFEPFLDATINPVLAVTRSFDYSMDTLPAALRRVSLRKFGAAAAGARRFRQLSDKPPSSGSIAGIKQMVQRRDRWLT
jgi:hypothetical protein